MKLSIAMPYWNRPRELERSLASYAKVYPNLDLEFSVCDDGSSQPPGRLPRQCVLTKLKPKTMALNPCVPINRAVRACTRDVIVLTNPEIVHTEPVLQSMFEALTGPDDYVMTGCRNAVQRVGLFANVGGDWIAGPEAPRAPIGGRQPMPPGAYLNFCVMFNRSLFERAGGFSEDYRYGVACDDNDWAWKLYSAGANFKYVPGTVWHYITRHGWASRPGMSNAERLHAKWGHLEKFKCA